MPPVVKVEDQPILVATTEYPYAKWKFEKFNPVQSRIMEFYDKDTNGLIAAATSAGKTVIAEQFISQEIRKRGGKGMYLAPLRALAREKINDWENKNYHFHDQKISICTGDFRLTKERVKELNDANIIIMTSEMLNSRCRNYKTENSEFLKEIGTLVIDESHLLTVAGRGDHLEVGLMKFTEINPNARLVLLSATMPNVEEIADWISYSLTKRDTFMLKSKYRPVPLTVHYESYYDVGRYDQVEEEKVNKALEIVEWYPDDKFLIFAHTKRTGDLMKQQLRSIGVEAQFHNADLEAGERAKVEDRFKNDPKLRVIVATSTLAWGLNLPARRVIILGVHRGINEVETHDILQMIGRSGRLGIDPMGDAYILVPESKESMYRQKFSKPNRIESQLLEKNGNHHKTLAFHLVSEIYHGDIKTTDDVHHWYGRSLAYFQNKTLDQTVVDATLTLLSKLGAIFQEDGQWSCRPIGKVSSMFYFSPFDVSGLYFNFKELFADNRENNDYYLSIALGDIDSQRLAIVSRLEKEEMSMYAAKVKAMMPDKYLNDSSLKAGFCYYSLLTGKNTQACATTQRTLQFDFGRMSQVLRALDAFGGNWQKDGFFTNLESRVINGVPSYLVDLCRVPNIGKVRAQKLYDAGFKTVDDVASMNFEKFKTLINMKKESAEEAMKHFKKISLT
jgi:helicase